jgi:Mg2+/citrate symporter
VVKFHPILFLLGTLDIVAGISYILNIPLFPLYILILVKGIWGLTTGVQYKDLLSLVLSTIDTIFSILAIFSIKIDFFAVLMIIKGVISLV